MNYWYNFKIYSQEYEIANYEDQRFNTHVSFAYNKNRFSYDMARYNFACPVLFMLLLSSAYLFLKLHVSFSQKHNFKNTIGIPNGVGPGQD